MHHQRVTCRADVCLVFSETETMGDVSGETEDLGGESGLLRSLLVLQLPPIQSSEGPAFQPPPFISPMRCAGEHAV